MSIEAIRYYIKHPRRIFVKLSTLNLLNWMSDEQYLKLIWSKREMGYKLDLDHPKTFNEKLQYLKLHDRKPLYTTLVDKYAVKQYVSERIGAEHVIPVIGGPWKSANDIDFDTLPNQFVLKCNHDSGGLVICKDKSKLDTSKAITKLNKSLKTNYFLHGREWPYKNVEPCIFAEQYMEDPFVSSNLGTFAAADGLIDYKFYCFSGEPKFLYVSFANIRNGNKEDLLSFFDLQWKPAPYYRKDHKKFPVEIQKPTEFGRMIEIASALSKDIPFVRVDLFSLNNKILFSELTFFPGGGHGEFYPKEYNSIFGSWIDLSKVKETI